MILAVHDMPVVVVRGRDQPVVETLGYLAAEPVLRGRAEDDAPVNEQVWGFLTLGDEPDPAELRSRYPRLAATSFTGAPRDGGPGVPAAGQAEQVADRALSDLLISIRRPGELDALIRTGGWRPASAPSALHGMTAAVVGDDAEVAATTRRLLACECTVIPLPADAGAALPGVGAVVVLPSGRAEWAIRQPTGLGADAVVVRVADLVENQYAEELEASESPAAIRRAISRLAALAAASS